MAGGLSRAAVHEAGHVVVARALGRQVVLVRIGTQAVPDDHPHAGVLAGATAGGETRLGPILGPEIARRADAGEAFDQEHVDWLRAELVICLAGVAAEQQLLGGATAASGVGDTAQGATVARLLGVLGDADGGAARVARAEAIAVAVLDELAMGLEGFARLLSAGPIELDGAQSSVALEGLGVSSGSHQAMLEQLASTA